MPAPVRSSTPVWVTRPSVSTAVTANVPSGSSPKCTTALPSYAACSRRSPAAASIAAAVSSGTPVAGKLGEDGPRVPLHGHLAEPERPDGPRGIPHGIDLEPSGILAGLARRRDRHAGGRRHLGQPGAGADRADGGRIGAEDQDPGRGALGGELGPVAAGHEPEPDRIGPSRHQRGDEVGHRHDSAPGRLEDQRLARLAGPPGRAARHRAHRDGAQPLPGDRVGERPRRGEHPGGGLAPVDDGEPPHAPHSGIPEPNAACSEPRTSSGTAVRGTVV